MAEQILLLKLSEETKMFLELFKPVLFVNITQISVLILLD